MPVSRAMPRNRDRLAERGGQSSKALQLETVVSVRYLIFEAFDDIAVAVVSPQTIVQLMPPQCKAVVLYTVCRVRESEAWAQKREREGKGREG